MQNRRPIWNLHKCCFWWEFINNASTFLEVPQIYLSFISTWPINKSYFLACFSWWILNRCLSFQSRDKCFRIIYLRILHSKCILNDYSIYFNTELIDLHRYFLIFIYLGIQLQFKPLALISSICFLIIRWKSIYNFLLILLTCPECSHLLDSAIFQSLQDNTWKRTISEYCFIQYFFLCIWTILFHRNTDFLGIFIIFHYFSIFCASQVFISLFIRCHKFLILSWKPFGLSFY